MYLQHLIPTSFLGCPKRTCFSVVRKKYPVLLFKCLGYGFLPVNYGKLRVNYGKITGQKNENLVFLKLPGLMAKTKKVFSCSTQKKGRYWKQ